MNNRIQKSFRQQTYYLQVRIFSLDQIPVIAGIQKRSIMGEKLELNTLDSI